MHIKPQTLAKPTLGTHADTASKTACPSRIWFSPVAVVSHTYTTMSIHGPWWPLWAWQYAGFGSGSLYKYPTTCYAGFNKTQCMPQPGCKDAQFSNAILEQIRTPLGEPPHILDLKIWRMLSVTDVRIVIQGGRWGAGVGGVEPSDVATLLAVAGGNWLLAAPFCPGAPSTLVHEWGLI